MKEVRGVKLRSVALGMFFFFFLCVFFSPESFLVTSKIAGIEKSTFSC